MSPVRTRSMAAAEYSASGQFSIPAKKHHSSSVTVILVNQRRCKLNRHRNASIARASCCHSNTLASLDMPSVKLANKINDHCTDISSSGSFDLLEKDFTDVPENEGDQVQQCSTPRSKEYRIPESHLCPPAPRKKRPCFYGVSSARSSVLGSAYFIVPDFNVLLASTAADNCSIVSTSVSTTSQ